LSTAASCLCALRGLFGSLFLLSRLYPAVLIASSSGDAGQLGQGQLWFITFAQSSTNHMVNAFDIASLEGSCRVKEPACGLQTSETFRVGHLVFIFFLPSLVELFHEAGFGGLIRVHADDPIDQLQVRADLSGVTATSSWHGGHYLCAQWLQGKIV